MIKIDPTECRHWLGSNFLALHLPTSKDYVYLEPAAISTDSRTLEEKMWYLALKGDNFDGNQFVADSIRNGAAGVICENHPEVVPEETTVILVKDSNKAMQQIAHQWRHMNRTTKVIALTGSVGKTTVRQMLSGIIVEAGLKILVPEGNFNNEIGVPKSLFKLSDSHDVAVLEFGARHQGDIKLLTHLALPDIVICLNIGTSHIEEFGGLEQLRATKLEILRDSLPEARKIGFDEDPDMLREAKVHFGWSKSSKTFIDFTKNLLEGGMQTQFGFCDTPEKLTINFRLAQDSQPINAAAAITAALELGISKESIKNGLENYAGVPGRFYVTKKNRSFIVDDSYNASPESLESGLRSLSLSFPSQSKTLILGDMAERGAGAEREHLLAGAWASCISGVEKIIFIGLRGAIFQSGFYRRTGKTVGIELFEDVSSFLESDWRPHTEVVYMKASHSTGVHKINTYLKNIPDETDR